MESGNKRRTREIHNDMMNSLGAAIIEAADVANVFEQAGQELDRIQEELSIIRERVEAENA